MLNAFDRRLLCLFAFLLGGLVAEDSWAQPRISTVRPGGRSSAEDESHRLLPPDRARMEEFAARARRLMELQQFLKKQGEIPGLNDPERQKRMQKILNQMGMKLGQSGFELPGTPGRPERTRPGRNSNGTTSENWKEKWKEIQDRIGEFSSEYNRENRGSRNGESENADIWNSLPGGRSGDSPNGEHDPGEGGDWADSEADYPPLERGGTSGGYSPFDDATDSSLSLTDRLTRIADRARANSLDGQGNGGKDGNSEAGSRSWLSSAGIQAALERAIDGAAETLTNEGEENGFQREEFQRRNSGRNDEGHPVQAIGETANWLSNLANRATEASERAHESMAGSTSSGASFSSFDPSSLLLPIILLAAGCGVVWWLQRKQPDFDDDAASNRPMKMPKSIRSRSDVVTAFHVIAARTPSVHADWWTHRRAALAMVETEPKAREAVEILVDVYEQARYLPEDASLSAEQLSMANDAAKRIGRS